MLAAVVVVELLQKMAVQVALVVVAMAVQG
jgi:hypothetical protein